MLVETVVVTEFMTNCYILADDKSKDAIVIDPGGDGARILDEIKKLGVNVKSIINTHAHVDHVGANRFLKEKLGVGVMMHRAELPILQSASKMGRLFGLNVENQPDPDGYIAEGDVITCGSCSLTVMETPGHSPGGLSFYAETQKLCFAGDSLFAGSIGRTDLPGGDYETLIASIKQRLLSLPDDVKVFTGHGPATTIGQERRYNPFVGGC